MEHYVNIMLDSGFKAVFGDKQVMLDFINAALHGEREVTDLTYKIGRASCRERVSMFV